MMDYKHWIGFEVTIMDLLDAANIKDEEDFERMIAGFHSHLETAIEDWAIDNEFEHIREVKKR